MIRWFCRVAFFAILYSHAFLLNASLCTEETASTPSGVFVVPEDIPTPPADTIPYIRHEIKPARLVLPGVLIGLGVFGTAVDGMNDYHLFERSGGDNFIRADDYLEFGMLGWTFLGNFFAEPKHDWIDQLFMLGLAEGINIAMVQTIKHQVNERRPNRSGLSFPSGHTSDAFVGAHMAFREFRETNLLMAVSGYPLAAFVAFSRIYRNWHWVADVIGGAGFGILSVELAYMIYPSIHNTIAKSLNLKKRNSMAICPTINPKGAGVYLSFTF